MHIASSETRVPELDFVLYKYRRSWVTVCRSRGLKWTVRFHKRARRYLIYRLVCSLTRVHLTRTDDARSFRGSFRQVFVLARVYIIRQYNSPVRTIFNPRALFSLFIAGVNCALARVLARSRRRSCSGEDIRGISESIAIDVSDRGRLICRSPTSFSSTRWRISASKNDLQCLRASVS